MTGVGSADSDKDSTIPRSTTEIIRDFGNYTTTHGVGRLAEAKTIFSRLIWTTFILGAFSMFIYQTRGLFQLYLSRPVSTLVQVRCATEAFFPTVVVCNQNPVRKDKIPPDYFKSIKEEIRRLFGVQNEFPSLVSEESWEDLSGASKDSEFVDAEREMEIEYLFEDMLIGKLSAENYTTLHDMGEQFNDFVFDCNFRGKDCRNYSKFWTRFWDYRYGNCYQFNSGWSEDGGKRPILKTRNTGHLGGLKLNLYINSRQYVPQISHAGARVVILDQRELPFPDEEGINAVPGTSTVIGVRREVITRADPFNNGSCKKPTTDENGMPYSRESCMRSCLADAQIAECGCAESQYAIKRRPICRKTYDNLTDECPEDIVSRFRGGRLGCQTKCPMPCREVLFKTAMSMVEWPAKGYKDILFKRLQKRPNEAYEDQLSEGTEFLHKNFLQIQVFYERLSYQEVEEKLSYKEVNLLADIGGQLGLWIGISVLTCCEFLELLLLLGKNAMKRITKKENSVQALSPNEYNTH
ncbi:amiloride-sensitive sodium channel subunit alpha-like [Montipora foliosa]|uniref:amiloride-sensitive sodium channel subunit alpha-like n=1 Tax=Montipora foliosa TaxID=591990 RepID=UPI0035F1CDD5